MARVTLSTIAQQTGLSKFAVSRSLAGKDGVSDETRKRVHEVAVGLVRLDAHRTLAVELDQREARERLLLVRQAGEVPGRGERAAGGAPRLQQLHLGLRRGGRQQREREREGEVRQRRHGYPARAVSAPAR